MLGWIADIEQATLDNTNFRTVMYTGEHTQLTLMRIEAGGDIGLETHPDNDQFIRIEEGKARVELGPTEDQVEETHDLEPHWAIIVPAGTWHNVINTGDGDLKVYSLYSPPHHAPNTVHRTKDEAMAAEHA